MTGPDPALRRIRWILIGSAMLLVLWQSLPWVQRQLIQIDAEPRSVAARGDLAADEQATIAIFERTSPSVVFITTRQRVVNMWTRDVTSVRRGSGSGFFWDEFGHVVTNNHVIEGASEAIVSLNDGRSYRAVLVGRSPAHDLAVLRINVPFDRRPPIPLGTSGDLRVGQKVFAIGNPFGLDYSLSGGLVSALDRSIDDDDGGRIEHLIQTDAAINPGNSGGPLLDSAGRLIGINTAIYSPSGAYAGIGFAVPVDTVNRVVPQLIAEGRYVRPTLGISVDEDVNRRLARRLDVEGVAVLRVEPGSGADIAGLQAFSVDSGGDIVSGDIIRAVDGKPTTDVTTLLSVLDSYAIGDVVSVTVWRDGRERSVTITLGGGG
ncbi:MAG: trypsin-like peptidase domain-containing protein [Gammaproteobacteria bacterium]|nr:trypsin-like peptidase domain-containing protein [Gammaproteobacteria bacterium]